MCEYDANKLAVSCWEDNLIYLIDRNSQEYGKMDVINDPDKKNINCTDLIPMPSYHPKEAPFFLKRAKNSL